MKCTSDKRLRILFQGTNWYGSCARACCMALRRLGHELVDVDYETLFPQLRRQSSRALLRLFRSRLVGEYNELIADIALWFKPDIFLAFKGTFVKSATLARLRNGGAILYNYFPDPSPVCLDGTVSESVWDYDCMFYAKRQWDGQRFLSKFRRSVFIPHGYDPEVHRPWSLDPRDALDYAHDVVVIAAHSEHKEKILDALISVMPSLDLAIWGNFWKERCRSWRLKPCIRGYAVTGSAYAKAICAAKINLALLMGSPPGLEDQTTTRTYEITACGGFMLHERSAELATLFIENEEVASFDSTDELATKVAYYLAHPQERIQIAAAGHRRCVPAYSYDNRMRELLAWHFHEFRPCAEADDRPITLGPSSITVSD